MDITQIIVLIIAVLGLVLTGVFFPYAKTKVSADKLSMVYSLVKIAVNAAEQIYGSKMGEQKKQYVVEYLAQKGIYVDVDIVASEFNAMIESAVYELSREQEAISNGKEDKQT